MADDKVKDKMMYVLRQENVSEACTRYGLFTASKIRPTAVQVIEPQREISDLVKLMKHDFKGSHWLALSFDRPPQDIPELSVDINHWGKPGADHIVRYSELTPTERREFIAQMSDYGTYGTDMWMDKRVQKAFE